MKYILLLVFGILTMLLNAQEIVPTNLSDNTEDVNLGETGAVMTFESMVVDYGTIEQHAEPLRKLSFTNTGDAPLIIQNARGSCGCTVPTWPKKPIMPGESSVLEIRYATNRIGQFSKTVTLTTNEIGTDPHVVKVQGKVLKPVAEKSVPEADGLIKSGGRK
ncbi:MAG: DUF1573 domain-containing protein [Saprospiraceae bacterium]